MNTLLFEILVEEIPHRLLPEIKQNIYEIVTNMLKNYNLTYKKVDVYVTIRRIAIIIRGLPSALSPKNVEYIGPRSDTLYDENKNFLPQVIGFAKKIKANPKELKIIETNNGKFVGMRKTLPGEKITKILTGDDNGSCLVYILKNLKFKKSMMWNSTSIKFIRPIRGFVAIINTTLLKFNYAGIKSNKFTEGLNTIPVDKIKINNANNYEQIMKKHFVILDFNERKQILKKTIDQILKKLQGNIIADEDFINEVVNMVEYPVAILSNLDEKYKTLPKELLIHCIQNQQKSFLIVDRHKNIMPHFIIIKNGLSENLNITKEGYENVVNSRLTDAQLFFNSDLKVKFSSRKSKLKDIVHIDKIGNMYDKTIRVKNIVEEISNLLNFSEKEKAIKIAEMANYDLTTKLVYEFPEIVGIAGRIYAEKENFEKEICEGIEQHHYPKSFEDKIPEYNSGCIVSIADKIDSLSSHFLAQHTITGSEDPFGLRKLSYAIIKILDEKKWDISLRNILDYTLKQFKNFDEEFINKIKTEITNYLLQRIETYFIEKRYPVDEVRSVINSDMNIFDMHLKLDSFMYVNKDLKFKQVIIVFKRLRNILKQAQEKNIEIPEIIDENMFQTDEERQLYNRLNEIKNNSNQYIQQKKYTEYLNSIGELSEHLEFFFKKVLVMCEDENLKKNRLGLLKMIFQIATSFADFSKIV